METSRGPISTASNQIRDILASSQTQSCSMLWVKVGEAIEEEYQTYSWQKASGVQHVSDDDGTKVYRIGSVTKLLIAIALHLIMDVYRVSEKLEHQRYSHLTGWNQSYVEALNSSRAGRIMDPLLGDPSIQHILLHFKGIPDVNRIILAPDGTQLMSRETFITVASRLSRFPGVGAGWSEYSNGNYVLLGILIETLSDCALGEFLQTEILGPLNMTMTFVNAEKLANVANSSRAFGHIMSKNGAREPVEDRSFGSDCVELTSLGIYSCTRDLGILCKALLPKSSNLHTPLILDERFVGHLFGYDYRTPGRRPNMVKLKTNRGDEHWAGIGLVTSSNSLQVGSRSVNRLVLQDDSTSSFPLGIAPENRELELCYQAGSVSTYSCCLYIVKDTNQAVIVMNNTLGRGDAADYVSRIIIQTSNKLHVRHRLHLPPGPVQSIPQRAEAGALKFFRKWQELWTSISSDDHSNVPDAERFVGLYKDQSYLQNLKIECHDGTLTIEFVGSAKRSEKMRLMRSGPASLRICPRAPSIDMFHSWKDLDLLYEQSDLENRVHYLRSQFFLKGMKCEIIYQRQHEG